MVEVLSIFSIVIIKKIGIRRNQRRIRKHTSLLWFNEGCDVAEKIKVIPHNVIKREA